MQEEQRRRKQPKAEGEKGIVEEFIPGYSNKDLEMLPPVEVVLPESQLIELAKNRARVLYDHLVNQLRIDPQRVQLSENSFRGMAVATIEILPYIPPGMRKQ